MGERITGVPTIVDRLIGGEGKLAIIGLGYLGYSNLLRYVKLGIRCTITDFISERVAAFSSGTYPPLNRFGFWKGMNELRAGRPGGTLPFEIYSPEEIVTPETICYMVCVHYDYREGQLSEDMRRSIRLLQRLKEFQQRPKPLVVFEAYLKPYTMTQHIVPAFERLGLKAGEDFLLAFAPRKDWFLEEFEQRTLPRKVACTGLEAVKATRDFFEFTHGDVVISDDFTAVELCECLENTMVHIANSVINQLMFAYPEVDIGKVAALYRPSVERVRPGISGAGSKASLGSQFLIDAAAEPSFLTIPADTLSSGFSIQHRLVELVKQKGIERLAILGLIPYENTAEYKFDPALLLPQLLVDAGIQVTINDPFIPDEEINRLVGCPSRDFPDLLHNAQSVLLLTSHTQYRLLTRDQLIPYLAECRLLLDNTGIWSRYDLGSDGIDYRRIGSPQSLAIDGIQ